MLLGACNPMFCPIHVFRYGNTNTTQLLNTVPGPVDGIQVARCAFWSRQHPVPYNS